MLVPPPGSDLRAIVERHASDMNAVSYFGFVSLCAVTIAASRLVHVLIRSAW